MNREVNYDAKETFSDLADNGKGVDITKRLDINDKPGGYKEEQIDISKRINVETTDNKELTDDQKKELLNRGMSPKILKDCKYEDGVYKLKTRNYDLSGDIHPQTNVRFEKKTINLFGLKIEGVFPVFRSYYTTELPKEKLHASDADQFDYCTGELQKAINKDPNLRKVFDKDQIKQINEGYMPTGYTWHHNEKVGKMELVKTDIHLKTAHTGGKAIWGGGKEER